MANRHPLEEINIIPLNIPVDGDSGVLTTDIWSMALYEDALLVLYFADGTAGQGDVVPTLAQCTDKTNSLADNKALNSFVTGRILTKLGADETALRALTAWTEETQAVADEVWTDATSAEQCGLMTFWIRDEDLDRANNFDCVYASINADGGAAKLVCALAILLHPRYPAAPILMKDPLH